MQNVALYKCDVFYDFILFIYKRNMMRVSLGIRSDEGLALETSALENLFTVANSHSYFS